MHPLTFTLAPDGVARIHDVVVCLAKFGELISMEARRNTLILTTLNSSKSAYASFSFSRDIFFEKYNFNPSVVQEQQHLQGEEARFTCQLYNKALLSVFKGRLNDNRERNTSVERCEVSIQDRPDKTECRLVAKMICRHGVTKTYKLTYESIEIMRALFDKSTARNRWSMGSSVLRSFTEYFGSNTEQLDVYSEAGRFTFTSYTEKIMDGKEVLKQPLQTSVTIETGDFEDFSVQEKLHIGISVKDFRAIVTHADTFKTQITALYSHPTRPMQLAYQDCGILCEFTLMTIGDYRGSSATPTPGVSRSSSAAPTSRATSAQPSSQACIVAKPNSMLPPTKPASRKIFPEPASQRIQRLSPPPPKPSLEGESLFLSVDDDDDRVWGEKNYDEDEDHIGWDASAGNDALPRSVGGSRAGGPSQPASRPFGSVYDDIDRRIAPTQRISEITSMFDD